MRNVRRIKKNLDIWFPVFFMTESSVCFIADTLCSYRREKKHKHTMKQKDIIGRSLVPPTLSHTVHSFGFSNLGILRSLMNIV